jgi:hypothetical protein
MRTAARIVVVTGGASGIGEACVRRFDPTMHRDAMEWLELESDLRMGVDRREFFLELQRHCRARAVAFHLEEVLHHQTEH